MKLFKKHFTWFMDRIDQDRLDSTAAHGAFFLLISFLPFVAFCSPSCSRSTLATGSP